jgi:large subunit ribosomal protein L17
MTPVRKLSRKAGPRQILLRNLATSAVLYEKIHTTDAKAKAVRPLLERLVTYAREGSLAARRRIAAELLDPNAVRKLMEDAATRTAGRTSGFVRLTKTMPRRGDGSAMAYLELLFSSLEVQPSKPARKTAATEKKTTKADAEVAEEPTTKPVDKEEGEAA